MRKDIQVGDKTVGFLSNGATVIYYRNIFGQDFLKVFNQISDGTLQEDEALQPVINLAYVMNLQALASDGDKDAKKILRSGLNEDTFIEWLEGFNPLDIPMKGEDILEVYTGNLDEVEKPKKK